jgi:hypothetical protein
MASIPYSSITQTSLPASHGEHSIRIQTIFTSQGDNQRCYRGHSYNLRRMLRTFSYSGGHFDVEAEEGDERMFARIPIAFEIYLAPDADRCYLDDVGKLLSVFIAAGYGEEKGLN